LCVNVLNNDTDDKRLDDDEILAIIASELSRSNYSNTDQGYGQLEESMSLYLGLPNGNEVPGRSAVTSTDVADSIEWIMPQIMESFTQVNEIVRFDPVGADDARQADIESQFVYDILMKENNGFIVIHEMIKDALIQRNGVLKVYYENNQVVHHESFTGIDNNGLAVLSQIPHYQITSINDNGDSTYNVSVSCAKDDGHIVIECVPLEEFRINAQHNSININKARFTAHVVTKTLSDLVKAGYPEELLEKIPNYHNYRRDYRFAMMHENSTGALVSSADESQHFVQVHECHMNIDIDGDGIAELMKITCAGSTDTPNVILDMEELDDMPWITTTPILMPHKFQGLSITDRTKEIQLQKTTLIRNIFDNMYIQNNGRYKLLENQVNMDDFLTSRPGGGVRVKTIDAIMPLDTPQLGPVPFQMIEYLDKVRAGRTGVDADGGASPVEIGDRVGSEGVERMLNGKEALVGLIIRTIAETGIKPLMTKIRDLAIKHMDVVKDYEFRGEWIKVAPTQWVNKRNSTVKVGSGSGDKKEKVDALNAILQYQTTAIQNPQQVLVDQAKVFNTLDDICKLSGLNTASRYFIDPSTQVGQQKQMQVQQQSQQQAQKDMQVQLAQYQLEAKVANAQETLANAQLEATRLKHQIELYKVENDKLKAQLDQYKTGIDAANRDDQLQYNYDKLMIDSALQLTKIEADSKSQQDANYVQNRGDISVQ
jgi:hypothetical protein